MFEYVKSWFNSSTKNQYLAIVVINLLAVAHGCVIGWTSPTIPYLRSDETHIKSGPLTTQQASWIGSVNLIGSLITTFTIGFLRERIGEKKTLLLIAFPNLISWIIFYFSTQVWHLYAARIIAGLSSGGMLRIIPMFTGKIAESKVRGALSSIYPFAMTLGNLVMYIFAGYFSFHIPPLIAMSLPVSFFFGLLFLPETPHFHLSRNENEKALKSLMFYRNCEVKNDLIEEELETFEKSLKNVEEEAGVKDFLAKENRSALLISFFLMVIGAFSGAVAIVTYTTDIFGSTGSSLSPIESSIIVGSIQLFGVYISTITTDKYGRKFLMSISCFGTFFFLFIMATYDFMIDREIIENSISLNWIPIVSLSMAVFVMSLGVIPIPFLIVAELVQQKIREASMMIFMAILIILSFLNAKIFPLMMELINLYGCLWLYSGICFFGCLISIFVLPETKGKKLFENSESEK